MSFFDKLQNKTITYIDKLVSDPETEELEKKKKKDLKKAQGEANKVIEAEKTLLNKAKTTRSPGRPEETLRYSIFPEDSKEIQTYLDDATNTVSKSEVGADIDDFINEHFDENYKNYKINSIFNTSVYANAVGGRAGHWLILRGVKQFVHDSDNISRSEITLLNKLFAETQQKLANVKYKKTTDWDPISVEDLKNVQTYKNLFQTQMDIESEEYKNVNTLCPKLLKTILKLLKNNGELDFNEEKDPIIFPLDQNGEGKYNANIDQDNFSATSAFYNGLNIALKIIYYLTICFLALIGASLAVNLNVHKPIAYRILYMIYGFIFGFIVVPYVLLYRWAYLNKKPQYYGFLPLINGHFENSWVQFILGWLTYKSDENVSKMVNQ